MFTSEIGVDAIKLEASNIPVDQEIIEYEKIVISANDSKTIALNVSNSTNQTLHYGAWYQMVNPNTINDNITIAKLTDSPDETSGTVNGNSNKTIYIYVGNNSNSTITLYVGIKYSETSSLNLPDNRTLITETRDGKYVVDVTVTNGTVENGVTLTNLITNGSFENGSNGWSNSRLTTSNNNVAGTISSSKHATGNNSLYINDTSDTTGYWNYQYFISTIGDKIYVQIKSNVISIAFHLAADKDNTGSAWEFDYSPVVSNEFLFYSKIYTTTSSNQYLRLGSTVVANKSEGYFDDIMAVNLTDSYGSNTPSQEILDRSISYFDGSVNYNFQKLNKGNSTSFKVNANSGYGSPSVTCTNSSYNYNESNGILNISNITGDVSCHIEFKEQNRTSQEMLEYLGLKSNGVKETITSTATSNEGIYETTDDYGTTYYFRGNVVNNYVKFAGFYWRIVRINGDGTLRLIYDGTSAHANGENSADRHIGSSKYNNSYNDNAYIGYMYGQAVSNNYNDTHRNTNSSTVKTVVDNWYKKNIADKGYGNYIADVIYCADRKISTTGSWNGYGRLGYGTNNTLYDSASRTLSSYSNNWASTQQIKMTCSQKNDRFTVDDTTKGNGALTYPVGLLTVDESLAAGGKGGSSNNNYYLDIGISYWTMSPCDYRDTFPLVFFIYGANGGVLAGDTSGVGTVRPVLSLRSSVILTGSGTQNDPWVVQ